jgi:hypothetical protein
MQMLSRPRLTLLPGAADLIYHANKRYNSERFYRDPVGSLDRQEARLEYAPDLDQCPGAHDCRHPAGLIASGGT